MDSIRVGVFGAWRGLAYIRVIHTLEDAEVTAILEKDPEKCEKARAYCGPDVKLCKDFDELLASGIQAVILANYFPEHAAYAIRAMKAGVDVFSECLPAVTMRECVELVETAEKTGRIYALAENCVYFRAAQEIERVYRSGILGKVVYAEGEYTHPMSVEQTEYYSPESRHWRKYLPMTYYLTHSMAPLMAATDLMPRKVIGKVAAGWEYARERNMQNADGAGILLVEMEGGALFRISGCSHFGRYGLWYRIGCDKGEIENLRGSNDEVRVAVSDWNLTDNMASGVTVYAPRPDELAEKAKAFSHGGADYRVTHAFIQDLRNGRKPYMDVYRSAALSATAILGWRSVLEGSRQIEIPDFRDPAAREKYRTDERSPFWSGDTPPDLPCSIHSGVQSTE